MAKCTYCGKKGIFMRVNARGLCEKCAEKAKAIPSMSQIVISTDGINRENVAIGHTLEEEACHFFIEELSKRGKDVNKFSIEHPSQDYTSLAFDTGVFLRIKMTSNVNWISIFINPNDRKEYENSPLFVSQNNKNELFWKSYFDSFKSLVKYLDIVFNACRPVTYDYNRNLSSSEIAVADYIMQLFINCGADPSRFYCHILSTDASIMYVSTAGELRFKAYARKPGGYLITDRDYEKVGIKGNKLEFSALSELDFLQERLIPIKMEKGLNPIYENDMEHYKKYPIIDH